MIPRLDIEFKSRSAAEIREYGRMLRRINVVWATRAGVRKCWRKCWGFLMGYWRSTEETNG